MKKIFGVILFLFIFVGMGAFAGGQAEATTDQKDQMLQDQLTAEAQRETGMPAITNFQEKKIMKDLYELRDQAKIITYIYSQSAMTGKFIFVGKAIGFPIPYATQYSNPEKRAYTQGYREYGYNLPQSEPNGLFMPSSADGTWIMLIDPKTGNPSPTYFEPRMSCSLIPLPASIVQQ